MALVKIVNSNVAIILQHDQRLLLFGDDMEQFLEQQNILEANSKNMVVIPIENQSLDYFTETIASVPWKYWEIVKQIVSLIVGNGEIDIAQADVHFARLIRHTQYFIERYFEDKMLFEDYTLYLDIISKFPHALDIAVEIKSKMELQYGKVVSDSELVFFVLQISHFTKER
uniref:PRD domain-containing protein n=1 Tax=Candidatus Enterococcus willemsii TaxID=1857215 RepID=UPI00403EFDFC